MALRDSMVGVIQSGQMAVGSALTGGGGAIAANDNGALPLLEDLRSISRENESNTQRLTNVLRDMFAFDKNKFARDRDQAREKEKEELKAGEGGPTTVSQIPDLTGDMGMKGLAAIAGLAFFAKQMGMNTDILKLPQQIKSIKGMATFAKGIGTISTLGLGPAIVRDFKLVMKQFGTNIKTMFNDKIGQPIIDKFDEFKKFLANSKLGQIFKNFDTKILQPIRNFFSFSKGAGPMATIAGYFEDAKNALTKAIRPITNFFKGLTAGTTGLFAAAGPLAAIMAPIRAVASGVSKLFLPLAAILGIFDGVSGFTKEYEDTGSIVDGIRGAVVAIVDGFIGSFVRLITDLVGMALEFLGLDNLGAMVTQFGEDVTKLFGDAVGGIVDFIMGIVTLDLERIWSGLTGAVGSAAGFFARVVTAPIDMAVNFVKDIFGFGDPEKPFSLIDFFLGDDGPIMTAWNWFKGLFTFDFSSLTKRLFDMGRIFKALASGGIAAAKAILPGGESPAEAFTRVYNETVDSGRMQDEAMAADSAMGLNTDFANTDEAKAAEAARQEILKENTTNNNGSVTYIDNSTKSNQNNNNMKSDTYVGSLDTGIDSYHDRYAFAYSPYA